MSDFFTKSIGSCPDIQSCELVNSGTTSSYTPSFITFDSSTYTISAPSNIALGYTENFGYRCFDGTNYFIQDNWSVIQS
jgi:hypothetical protein